jgi:hypothetical protein
MNTLGTVSEPDPILTEPIADATDNISSPDTTYTATTSTSNGTTFVPLVPSVEFINIPTAPVIDRDLNITLVIHNAHSPRLYLVSPAQNYRGEIKPTTNSTGGLSYPIRTSDIPAGEYHFLVVVQSQDTDLKYTFNSRNFSVAHAVSDTTVLPTQDLNTSFPIETIDTDNSIETTVQTDTEQLQPTEPSMAYDVDLSIEPLNINPKIFRVFAKTKNSFDRVELYLRNTASVQRTFLGLGTKVTDGYVYWLDTSAVPAGSYMVVLQGRVQTQIAYTATSDTFRILAPAPVVVDNSEDIEQITTTLKETTTDSPEVDYLSLRKEAATIPVAESEIVVRETTPIMQVPVAQSPATIEIQSEDPEEMARVRLLMQERNDALNDLLQKHASALQTKDEMVLRLAQEALANEVKALALATGESEEESAEIERLMSLEINRIKEKIEITDNIIKARTNNKIAYDGDLDGISDYDEVTIYNTNPKEVDTDSDGVIDGIEIMRGFNPTDAVAEVVIDYSSPKDFGYVNETVLKVENVAPIVHHDNPEASPIIKSEIRGFGLPNSFVTLYIYSTPTVVTVKTNSDGSFSYVFDKELEDGAHEVYVALTDNTGDIVVKSNAFSFVKTAQAFTYEDSLESTVAAAPSPFLPSELSKTFIVTVAMSVVALGFVLVILGHMLRTRRQEEQLIT